MKQKDAKEEAKSAAVKAAAVIAALIVIANFVMFALGRASVRTFWLIVIGGAVIAYFVIPHYSKKQINNV